MSREKILNKIRKNKPELHPLPEAPRFTAPTSDLVKAFTLVAEGSGTNVRNTAEASLVSILEKEYPGQERWYSRVAELPSRGLGKLDSIAPLALKEAELAILPGQLAVAENGAVWVSESDLGIRVSAFIAQHLALVVPLRRLVWNMHDAYREVRIDATGFGVFIAGPSKTADIEQSLVIGAQAARSLTVVFTD